MDQEFRGKGVVAYQAFTVYHFSNDKDLLYFAVIATKKKIKLCGVLWCNKSVQVLPHDKFYNEI